MSPAFATEYLADNRSIKTDLRTYLSIGKSGFRKGSYRPDLLDSCLCCPMPLSVWRFSTENVKRMALILRWGHPLKIICTWVLFIAILMVSYISIRRRANEDFGHKSVKEWLRYDAIPNQLCLEITNIGNSAKENTADEGSAAKAVWLANTDISEIRDFIIPVVAGDWTPFLFHRYLLRIGRA